MLSSKTSHAICTPSTSRQVAAISLRATQSTLGRPQQVAQQQQQHFSSGQAAAARQQRSLMQLPHAVKDEEAELDRITKEAGQSDIWGNEVVGNAVKVGIVAGAVAFVLLIGNLAKPIYDNTIKSFPTPAEYELYEQREDRGL